MDDGVEEYFRTQHTHAWEMRAVSILFDQPDPRIHGGYIPPPEHIKYRACPCGAVLM